jgi:hypothetical protein
MSSTTALQDLMRTPVLQRSLSSKDLLELIDSLMEDVRMLKGSDRELLSDTPRHQDATNLYMFCQLAATDNLCVKDKSSCM